MYPSREDGLQQMTTSNLAEKRADKEKRIASQNRYIYAHSLAHDFNNNNITYVKSPKSGINPMF